PLEKSLHQRIAGCALGTKRFLWFRFFDAHQRNELGRAAGETLLIWLFDCSDKARTRSKAFAFGDFISFDWRQKKRSKEKRLVPRANPGSRRRGDFSRGHPALVEKRRTSMCGALRVCGIQPGVGIFSVKSER